LPAIVAAEEGIAVLSGILVHIRDPVRRVFLEGSEYAALTEKDHLCRHDDRVGGRVGSPVQEVQRGTLRQDGQGVSRPGPLFELL
jgi:hypothetical protein